MGNQPRDRKGRYSFTFGGGGASYEERNGPPFDLDKPASVVTAEERETHFRSLARERVGKPTLWQRFLEWREKRWLQREFDAAAAEMAESIAKLYENVPDAPTAEELRARHDELAEFELRRDWRIREGRDPDTGIDPVTGLDDFDMNADQRDALKSKWESGQLTFKELPRNTRTRKRWDDANMTAVGTWRSTTSPVDPRSKFHFNPNEWVSTPPFGYMNTTTNSPFGLNGLTHDGKTPDEESARRAYYNSPEAVEARREEEETRATLEAMWEAERAESRFSYSL